MKALISAAWVGGAISVDNARLTATRLHDFMIEARAVYLVAARPLSIPAMPRSSSRSGQWIPIGMISKFARSLAVARWSRGWNHIGAVHAAPSSADIGVVHIAVPIKVF